MVLKCDSSMLVNRKPFFIPDWSDDIQMTPCVVLRVSRLGKNISAPFVHRYYDAVALGLNICAADYIEKGDWTRGCAFDYSLPLGKWISMDHNPWKKTSHHSRRRYRASKQSDDHTTRRLDCD